MSSIIESKRMELWKKFERSGNIEDYLQYNALKTNHDSANTDINKA